jgi:hypothetical protein
MTFISTKFRRVVRPVQYSLLALGLLSVCPTRLSLAQDAHQHSTQAAEAAALTDTQSALINTIRNATAKYQDVKAAIADGYALQFGCVSGDDFGAMGLHYVNANLVNNAVLDPTKPQIIIYEPTADGGRNLIGVDYLLLADAWNANHTSPPQLMGQLFHLFTAPNRFGLPTFYTLHVWAWKNNPKGAFVNWHSNVSCKTYNAQ